MSDTINSKTYSPLLNVVLIEPEIPNNTGNIGRTCVGIQAKLHLVGPLGFSIDDKQVRRAGLDYWQNLDLEYHRSREAWLKSVASSKRVFLIETGSDKTIFDVDYQVGDHLVFGRETKGLPREILDLYKEQILSVPFPGSIRSFNLSNCVAMVAGEVLRQFRQSSVI